MDSPKVYSDRPLIILDLDETLIHSTRIPLEAKHICLYASTFGLYYVYKRPHVDEFLRFCREHFDVAVWTAASKEYAYQILPKLFGTDSPKFVFTQERCTMKLPVDEVFGEFATSYQAIKSLKKVWCRRFDGKRYSRHRTLIVDDTSYTFQRNYGNAIHIGEWEGDPKDRQLLVLIAYLKKLLKESGSWRHINKTKWRSDVERDNAERDDNRERSSESDDNRERSSESDDNRERSSERDNNSDD